jgi:hypothetical protein
MSLLSFMTNQVPTSRRFPLTEMRTIQERDPDAPMTR